MCTPQAIQLYAIIRKVEKQKRKSRVWIFVRNLRAQVKFYDMTLSKISKEDFTVFMKDRVNPEF